MIDLKNFQSINLNEFFDSVKLRSGSGYQLVIHFCIVMFYMLMILMFSFVPQTFFRIFFFQNQDQDHDQDQDFTIKFIGKSYSLYTKDTHQIWCRFVWILFGSANSFESLSPRTDRRKFLFVCFVF